MIINDDNFDLLFVKPEKEIKQNEQIETYLDFPILVVFQNLCKVQRMV